jgi:hypothetical protein
MHATGVPLRRRLRCNPPLTSPHPCFFAPAAGAHIALALACITRASNSTGSSERAPAPKLHSPCVSPSFHSPFFSSHASSRARACHLPNQLRGALPLHARQKTARLVNGQAAPSTLSSVGFGFSLSFPRLSWFGHFDSLQASASLPPPQTYLPQMTERMSRNYQKGAEDPCAKGGPSEGAEEHERAPYATGKTRPEPACFLPRLPVCPLTCPLTPPFLPL